MGWGGKIIEGRVIANTRTQTIKYIKQGSQGFTKTERTIRDPGTC